MKTPEIPQNESERLKELDRYQLIGIAEDEDYDFITSTVAQICGTKISLICLVTEDKQWFLSHHGLAARETPRDYAFCAHAINNPNEPFIVEDARKDERFYDNPLTTGHPHVIFYVGIPLVTTNGYPLGTLCAIDDTPNQLNATQLEQLKKLARQTVKLLENTKIKLELTHLNRELARKNELLRDTQAINQLGIWEIDIASGKTTWSHKVYEILEVPHAFDHTTTKGVDFYHPEYISIISDAITRCISDSAPFDLICQMITAKDKLIWVRSTGRKVGDQLIGSIQDITKIKENELKFKGIFNSTFSFIWFLSTEGILLEANDTAVNRAGLKHEDVIGNYFWDCYWWQISPQTQQELKVNFQKALSGEQIEYEVDVWIANKTALTILFSLKPIFDDRGNVIFIIPEGRPVQEIIEARRKFKSVIEGTNVGTWEWNVQTGETIFNERWAEIVGYTLEELAPISIETWMKLAHPDDLEESGRRLNRCFAKEKEYYEFEAQMKHKNGHWIWVYDRGKVFEWTKDGKPLMMYGTHQDITERKKREEMLRISEEAFRSNFENAAIGMALLDESGSWLKVNAKVSEMVGYSEDELMKLTLRDITHPDDLNVDSELMDELIQGKRDHYQIEKRYFHKEGQIIHTLLAVSMVKNDEGKVLYSISQIIDISQEKEVEQKLREAIASVQAILDASKQVSIIATDTQGIITEFNSGAEILLGYKAEEVVGKFTPQIIHISKEIESHGEALSRKYKKEINGFEIFVYEAKRGVPTTQEWTYVRKDQTTFPVLLSINAVSHDNKIIGYLGVATDISELKKVENEIKSLLDTTNEQNERLRNFAHIVSHNLRSHSAGISGILEFLEVQYPNIAKNTLVELLKKGAESLKHTVHDLTEIVKVHLAQAESSEVNINEVIQKNIDSLGMLISDAQVEIINNLDPDLKVKGVPAYLDSIVLNMITNALKYRSKERASYLRIYAKIDESMVAIFFEDNGLGLDLKKYGDKLFGMYKTFHEHEDARGVGLFISKSQLEGMGGKIEVESEVFQGTTFKITLPK